MALFSGAGGITMPLPAYLVTMRECRPRKSLNLRLTEASGLLKSGMVVFGTRTHVKQVTK